jgi:hypothetical protein
MLIQEKTDMHSGTDKSNDTAVMMEHFGAALQADTLAAAEFLAGCRRNFPLEPERELVLALLEDALDCFQKYFDSPRPKSRRLFAETEAWFFSDDRERPLSFANVCDFLGLDPDYLRRGLRQEAADRSAVKRSAA